MFLLMGYMHGLVMSNFAFLLLPRIVPVPGGSNHKERELDLATCTE